MAKREEVLETYVRRTPINAWRLPRENVDPANQMVGASRSAAVSRSSLRTGEKNSNYDINPQDLQRARTTTPYVRTRRYSTYVDECERPADSKNGEQEMDPAKQCSFLLRQEYEQRKKKLQQVILLRKKSPAYSPVSLNNY